MTNVICRRWGWGWMGKLFLSGPMRNAIKRIVSLKRSEREAEGGKKRFHHFSPHFIEYPFFHHWGFFIFFLFYSSFFVCFSSRQIIFPILVSHKLCLTCLNIYIYAITPHQSCLLLNNNFTRIVTTHSNLVTDNILMVSCPMPIVCLKCLLPRRTHS